MKRGAIIPMIHSFKITIVVLIAICVVYALFLVLAYFRGQKRLKRMNNENNMSRGGSHSEHVEKQNK
ncbi:hypothetical protein D9X91_19410 [Falsibacillus albus]|uniref:Uncharacterized protein n=1 Tax=Falsibacillus albus TaxID=2478915 RepID=A0A3L7JQ64_9BACI|nr:hypothetical protein D9X91_19410 [Falsibacillus albus]